MNCWLVRISRFLLVCAVIALSCAYWRVATAQDDEQTELASSANYVYGQSMAFRLIARNIGEISKATLYLRLGVSPDSYAVEVPISPGSTVEAAYSLDLTQTRLPPFGTITYWWVLERPDGATLKVPEQVVNYVDDQFNWRQTSETDPIGGGSIRVYWTGDDEQLGEVAKRIITELLPEVSDLIPLEMILPFDVYIYPSSADLSAALRLAGREYIPGRSYPDLGVVLVTAVNPQTAEQDLSWNLARGLVDQLLYQAIGQYASSLPPWLPAGLAGVVQDRTDTSFENMVRLAVAENHPLPISNLCAGDVVDSDLALAQSESIMVYILQTYGDEAIREFLAGTGGGADCSTVFQDVFNTSHEEIINGWQRSLEQTGPQPMIVSTMIWIALVIAGFGLVFLLIVKPHRQNNRGLK